MNVPMVRRLGMVAVAAVALLATACDPIPHTQRTLVESSSAPVAFRLLSGDARFAVVEASGAGATVPGEGWWRVERATGATVRLPAAATTISRDGSRIALGDGTLWIDGTVLTPPAGARFSPDLAYAVFLDPADGQVRTWETATGAVGDVETAFPRPAGATAAPVAVSDDGRVVQYTLGLTERFVDLVAGTKVDIERAPRPLDPYWLEESFLLSADGSAVLHTYDLREGDWFCECTNVFESWAELVALPSGAPGTRWHNTSDEHIQTAAISGNGDTGWVYRWNEVRRSYGECGGWGYIQPEWVPYGPFDCVTSASVVAVGLRSHVDFGAVGWRIGEMDASPDGRFLAVDAYDHPVWYLGGRGPVRVLDRYSEQRVEVLPGLESTPSARARISDDGTVVATATDAGRGWYEYTSAATEP